MNEKIKLLTESHNRLTKGKGRLVKRLIYESTLEALNEVQNAKLN